MTASLFIGPPDDPDRYELWTKVGSGAEGVVWRATRSLDDGDPVEVAVKQLSGDGLHGTKDPAEVLRTWEAHVARLTTFNSHGIVPVQGAFLGAAPHPPSRSAGEATTPYFVMGWIDGIPLSEWAAEHAAVSGRLTLLEDVAAGLDDLHRNHLIHGDIKPANLVVAHKEIKPGTIIDRAVMVDFGLMRAATARPPTEIAISTGYCAPEVLGGHYSPASDMYALGCVVYGLLTGKNPPTAWRDLPPGADDVDLQCTKQMRSQGIDESIVSALIPCLARNPAVRPQGAAAWLSRVRGGVSSSLVAHAVAGRTKPLPVEPVVEDAAASERKSRKPLWAAVSSALAAIALIAGILIAKRDTGGAGVAAPSTTAVPTPLPATTAPPALTTTTGDQTTTSSTVPSATTTRPGSLSSLTVAQAHAVLVSQAEAAAAIGTATVRAKNREYTHDPASYQLCSSVTASSAEGVEVPDWAEWEDYGYNQMVGSTVAGFSSVAAAEAFVADLTLQAAGCGYQQRETGGPLGGETTRFFKATLNRPTVDLVIVRKGSNVLQVGTYLERGDRVAQIERLTATSAARMP